jgi:hypothetical protein
MRVAFLLFALAAVMPGRAVELSEYQLKAAFLYNFARFTEWPPEVNGTLKLCVHGRDPFGPELDELQGKPVGQRLIATERRPAPGTLGTCQIVFISKTAAGDTAATVRALRNAPILTIAESPGALEAGAMLNMDVQQDRITFSANLKSAQRARLVLSSKLLGLATEVVR